MKIVGDLIQEGIPTPESPKEIKTTTKIIIEGRNGERQEIELPKEKIDGFNVDKCDKCVIEDYNINCKDCIKQYFIRKVEENDNSTSK